MIKDYFYSSRYFILGICLVVLLFFCIFMPMRCVYVDGHTYMPFDERGFLPPGTNAPSPQLVTYPETRDCYSPLHKEFWKHTEWVLGIHTPLIPQIENLMRTDAVSSFHFF